MAIRALKAMLLHAEITDDEQPQATAWERAKIGIEPRQLSPANDEERVELLLFLDFLEPLLDEELRELL